MATYAIGDVQGCFASLRALLDEIKFNVKLDRLWLVGDLVNRGPDSLGVLRFLYSLGDRAICVLGNHDLHLLECAAGLAKPKGRDTFHDVLAAPDCRQLTTWLSQRPLLYREGDLVLVHAGLAPAWTVDAAAGEARQLENLLRDPSRLTGLLRHEHAPESLRILATIRTCHDDGSLCDFSGPPEAAPAGCMPWFAHPKRQSRDATIIFGHWAALGARIGPDYIALDSGCVWGKRLTALRLEDRRLFSVPAQERRSP